MSQLELYRGNSGRIKVTTKERAKAYELIVILSGSEDVTWHFCGCPSGHLGSFATRYLS